jgi:U4/U6 small nuclear ribonucleoprotein PRP31
MTGENLIFNGKLISNTLTFHHRVLLRPDLTVKKRRGGQRMRRLKGRYEETALMKQANTRAFSVQTGEYGDDAMGRTLGLLEMSTGSVGNDTSGTGAIRRNTAEKRKMKYANTRASRKMAAQANMKGLSSSHASLLNNSASGLASSMVFTPVQGMELVNPDAAKDRVREANRKWFHDNAGFQSALPRK